MVDKTLQDPARTLIFSNFEPPVAESKYIVSVKAKTENWQNFLYFSGMFIYPAHVLKNINGEAYIRDYNYKMLPGTGPYMVSEQDVDKGKIDHDSPPQGLLGREASAQHRHCAISTRSSRSSFAIAISSSRCSRRATSTTTSCSARRCGSRS